MRLRSLLFAPAVQPDLLRKLADSGADGVVIDCEDATPPAAKEEGRRNAREIGAELVADGRVKVFVRVNGFETTWFADDLDHGLPPGLAGVIIPKIEAPRTLDSMGYALDSAGHGGYGILAGLESAAGVMDAREILHHSRIRGAYFGAEDFIADMGGKRTESNIEVMYARSHVALAANLNNVPILDQVTVAYENDAKFRREAEMARAMGFTGKMCIHPRQVDLANEAFSPTEEEVAEAQTMVDAYARAGAKGSGIIVIDGRMIDEALVAQARGVLEAAGRLYG